MSGCQNCSCQKSYTLNQEIQKFIADCKQKEHGDSYLIAILHKVQNTYGFLSKDHMIEVAELLEVPTSVVSGVSTFYHFFRLKPRGKHAISVCMGTACFVKGAEQVLDGFKSELGIDMGEVTSDGVFSIEISRCIGVCAMAPVVVVNDKVFSNVKPTQVSEIIHAIKAEAVAKEA